MVDEEGRQSLIGLLRGLPRRHEMGVVHVTHRPEEAAVADRRFRLSGGVLVEGGDRVDERAASPEIGSLGIASIGAERPTRLALIGVNHIYGIGTPWAQTALEDINLEIAPREGVLIVGGNGSGKSTLAWIMAGLMRPTMGECLLGEEPVRSQVGAVGLAFQHARLQLQRATVGKDMKAAGAPDDDAAAAALSAVGLDPSELLERRIDELSGGQQRRVALAGLLARRPSVLVLDEPLAGLDRPSREGLIDLLARLRYGHGLTVVVISHDLHGMERLCDRTIRLAGGRIVDDTTSAEAAAS
jgi:energy-coupling factor transport system ATP-binding protein